MIKKLQNRFILISMLSILLVLTVIIGTINVLNYQKVVKDAEDILSILSENNGHFPKKLPPLIKTLWKIGLLQIVQKKETLPNTQIHSSRPNLGLYIIANFLQKCLMRHAIFL